MPHWIPSMLSAKQNAPWWHSLYALKSHNRLILSPVNALVHFYIRGTCWKSSFAGRSNGVALKSILKPLLFVHQTSLRLRCWCRCHNWKVNTDTLTRICLMAYDAQCTRSGAFAHPNRKVVGVHKNTLFPRYRWSAQPFHWVAIRVWSVPGLQQCLPSLLSLVITPLPFD